MLSQASALFAEPELPELRDGGQFSADLLLRPLSMTKRKSLGPEDLL